MNLIQYCIRYPVTTAAGVMMLLLFGGIALFQLPIQLLPNINQPVITVSTIWPGASPNEVEREIVAEQEEELKTIEGLVSMHSESYDSLGRIILRFQIGTNKDSAMIKIANRLAQVEEYPFEAQQPVISGEDEINAAAAFFWISPTETNGFSGDISTLLDFVEDFVKPELERVPGVSKVNVLGGRKHEIHVIFDPVKLALRGVTLSELADAVDNENRNFSGGSFDEGKRRYIVRTVGEYKSVEDLENIVVAHRDGIPVYLRDVAQAELNYSKINTVAYRLTQQMLPIAVLNSPESNVLEIVHELNIRRERLNTQVLNPIGLQLVRGWDESRFIRSAIQLVRNSLMIGGVLAIMVLWAFLRSYRSTLIIALCIPISIIGTLLVMMILGRSINLISLAGLAFATGMVLDNAIVVLENIYRHRQLGKPAAEAALQGTREVWGAVLASTLTTVAVFLPVTFVHDELGQLLADIAIAVCCAVTFSLLVAVTVVPSLAARMLNKTEKHQRTAAKATRLADRIIVMVEWINLSLIRKLGVVASCLVGAIVLGWILMPETEYLPRSKTDWVDAYLSPPPGYSIEELTKINEIFSAELSSLTLSSDEQNKDAPGGGIGDYFFVLNQGLVYFGLSSRTLTGAGEFIPEIDRLAAMIPGTIHFVEQWNIFAGVGSEAANIDLEILGPDLKQQVALAGAVLDRVYEVIPKGQAYPLPSLDLGNPELQILINRRSASELGISNRDLGFSVSALVDGAKASTYRYEGNEIDIMLIAQKGFGHRTHELEQMPIATAGGQWVTLGSVATLSLQDGPAQINHKEQQRTITIRMSPPADMSTEAVMRIVESEILMPMRASGEISAPYSVEMAGSADGLTKATKTLRGTFVLALLISFLLMAALFESFLYPLVIMISVPLAAFGGMLGLAVLNWLGVYQPLDTLTMLGFIILVGTVVNSAILIVHKSLRQMRAHGLTPDEAILAAVKTRIRPIFMTVGTSSLAVLPLILVPGAGAEVYRGLGTVVIGGLLVSTVFTLLLVPALLSLVMAGSRSFAGRWQDKRDS